MADALLPFFTFYGGKNRASRQGRYPVPTHWPVIEPFAGSAGYALAHAAGRPALLFDVDDNVVSTWNYLLRATPRDIRALPDLEPGQSVDDLDLELGARLLIGWWLNKGSASPKKRASTFARDYPQGGPYWGERVRERIASQLVAITDWDVTQASWDQLAGSMTATWFVDPPYSGPAGRRYRRHAVDYPALAEWCRRRRGQVIVCEAEGADWLPFRRLYDSDPTEGRQKVGTRLAEAVWTQEAA